MLVGIYRQLPFRGQFDTTPTDDNRVLSTRPPTNRKLSDAQDRALVNYIIQLYNIGVSFRQKHIVAAAESILRDAIAGRDSDPIGDHITPSCHSSLHDSPVRLSPYLIVGQAVG
jgi:hypothetical protein